MSLSISTDSSLLRRVQANDHRAWRDFVDLYGPLIYSWCRRQGLSCDDSADVTQDSFAAVVKSVSAFDHAGGQGSLRGWLWTITSNKTRDLFRKRLPGDQAVGGPRCAVAVGATCRPIPVAQRQLIVGWRDPRLAAPRFGAGPRRVRRTNLAGLFASRLRRSRHGLGGGRVGHDLQSRPAGQIARIAPAAGALERLLRVSGAAVRVCPRTDGDWLVFAGPGSKTCQSPSPKRFSDRHLSPSGGIACRARIRL